MKNKKIGLKIGFPSRPDKENSCYYQHYLGRKSNSRPLARKVTIIISIEEIIIVAS